MIHLRARRLLPALLDATLPARTEAALRAHLRRCTRCRDALIELEEAEALLGLLPRSLVPLAGDDVAELRLAALARWFPQPEPAAPLRPALSALGVAAAAVALVIGLVGVPHLPYGDGHGGETRLAAAQPDAAFLPLGWR